MQKTVCFLSVFIPKIIYKFLKPDIRKRVLSF